MAKTSTPMYLPDRKQVRLLEKQLIARIPSLRTWINKVHKEWNEVKSAYAIFSYGVRPYIEHLVENNAEKELRIIWGVLENLAGESRPEIKNELFVMMEELDLWKYYKYMGPLLRNQWFLDLTWFTEKRNRTTSMNAHVDKEKYLKRWMEEINSIGGFEKLSTYFEIEIRTKLWTEFNIEKSMPLKPKHILDKFEQLGL